MSRKPFMGHLHQNAAASPTFQKSRQLGHAVTGPWLSGVSRWNFWDNFDEAERRRRELRPFRYRDDSGLVHLVLKKKSERHRRTTACGLEFRMGLLTKVDVPLNCFGCMNFEKEG